MRQTSLPDSAVPHLGWVFLAGIFVWALAGFFVATTMQEHVDPTFTNHTAWLLTGLLLILALASMMYVRAIALPIIARQREATLATLAVLGYMFAESSAALGVAAAVISESGWRVIPFSAIAFVFWALVRNFLSRVATSRSLADSPRL